MLVGQLPLISYNTQEFTLMNKNITFTKHRLSGNRKQPRESVVSDTSEMMKYDVGRLVSITDLVTG